jgi:plastocyanin
MADEDAMRSRRDALRCMAFGGLGTLFTLTGGILTPVDLALAAEDASRRAGVQSGGGRPLFVQISDTHIGFDKAANPDVSATLGETIDLVNALPQQPALVIHTGDITHLSKPAQFDLARQLLSRLRTTELHTVPGEHDVADATASEYFARFGQPSGGRGYYSFDHAGVHFVALTNVLQFKPGGLGTLGPQQLAWVADDLASRSASTPIVVFAHMPLWTIYEPWGWGTGDAGALLAHLRRFGSVTVLNGHIHQIVQKVEGNITFHTANSTAFPQPAAGVGPGPGPLDVGPERLRSLLGMTSVSVVGHPRTLALRDTTLEQPAVAQRGEAAERRVVMRGFMFEPASLSVPAGSSVTWVNLDAEPHTIASDAGLFRSGALDTQESFSFRFTRPGIYRYVCSIHPRMIGTVTVTEQEASHPS